MDSSILLSKLFWKLGDRWDLNPQKTASQAAALTVLPRPPQIVLRSPKLLSKLGHELIYINKEFNLLQVDNPPLLFHVIEKEYYLNIVHYKLYNVKLEKPTVSTSKFIKLIRNRTLIIASYDLRIDNFLKLAVSVLPTGLEPVLPKELLFESSAYSNFARRALFLRRGYRI